MKRRQKSGRGRKRGQSAKLHSSALSTEEHIDVAEFGDYAPEAISVLQGLKQAEASNFTGKLQHALAVASLVRAAHARDAKLFREIARRLEEAEGINEAADSRRYALAFWKDRIKGPVPVRDLQEILLRESGQHFDRKTVRRFASELGIRLSSSPGRPKTGN